MIKKILLSAKLLFRGLLLYANPMFHRCFSIEGYLNSQSLHSKWARKYPKIHFCLFNCGKKAKKTILFISHELTRTGAPILLLNLIKSFGGNYNIAVVSYKGGEIKEEFLSCVSWLDAPNSRRNKNRSRKVKRGIKCLSYFLDIKFAIVNTVICSETLPWLSKKRIPSIHLIHEFSLRDEEINGLISSTQHASCTVFSSEFQLQSSIRKVQIMNSPNTRIIPQGIIAPSLQNSGKKSHRSIPVKRKENQGEILILGAGKVDYRKGVDLFLDCAKKTIESSPNTNIKFAWIGDGWRDRGNTYSLFLQDQLEKYEMGNRFQFIDEVKDFSEACKLADLFFLSSRIDPLPIVAQTAMAHGIPVVCFEKTTGLSEYLATDQTLLFCVSPYLDIKMASEKIIELAGNQELRAKVGDACRQIAETCFDWTAYKNRLEQLGSNIISKNIASKEDIRVISSSGLLDSHFAFKKICNHNLVESYVYTWKNLKIGLKKPMPGFHPGIFREDAMQLEDNEDPFACYIRKGKPEGRWTHKVLIPEEKNYFVPSGLRVALHLHFFYSQSIAELIQRASLSTIRPDLYISVGSDQVADETKAFLDNYKGWKHEIRVVPNKGRDVAPFLTEFADELRSYEFIGHVHTKETVHVLDRRMVELWKTFLLENVLGGRHPMIDFIVSTMAAEESLGIVFPDDPNAIDWTENRPFAEELAKRMKFTAPLPRNIIFPVGTMFWARSVALEPLFSMNLGWEDYPPEPIPCDGTILHAIERMIPLVAKKSGYYTAVTHIPGIYR
jgi:glycosyltransferase involved in cell wall biosynthesis